MISPFQYPLKPHVRRHGPRGYAAYSSYKPWLRDEFSFRCVYCLRREEWEKANALFDVDHFEAVFQQPTLVNDYDNLLYACSKCNLNKGLQAFPDPLTALTSEVLVVNPDGTIHADENSDAARLIELLGLNGQEYTDFRKLWIDIINLAWQKKPELFLRLMGYPQNLPNLRKLKPPHGNSRPTGLEHSAFAQRQRGELPSCY